LYAGRLVWEKDLRTLADAYRHIRASRDDVAFVLVGDGPVRTELQDLMPGAIFLGYQAGADLSSAFASSDVLVFPSTTETFGNVVIEAMASGLPVVCAKAGGAFGAVEDGVTGLHTAPRDPLDLARKVEHLLANPAMRRAMGHQGRLRAETYSWDAIFDLLFHHYLQIVTFPGVNRAESMGKVA
jgi:glycosyltransferase involved in cell wall biosynthesis